MFPQRMSLLVLLWHYITLLLSLAIIGRCTWLKIGKEHLLSQTHSITAILVLYLLLYSGLKCLSIDWDITNTRSNSGGLPITYGWSIFEHVYPLLSQVPPDGRFHSGNPLSLPAGFVPEVTDCIITRLHLWWCFSGFRVEGHAFSLSRSKVNNWTRPLFILYKCVRSKARSGV